jgi:hypothetical protein
LEIALKTETFSHFKSTGWNNLESAVALDSDKSIVVTFCSPLYKNDPEKLRELKRKFPNSTVVGCSTSGEIHADRIHDLSISGVIIRMESGYFNTAVVNVSSPDESESKGKELAIGLKKDDLKGLLLLSDGLQVNGSKLSGAIASIVDPNLVICGGGLAGDGNHFASTWTMYNGEFKSGQIIAIGFYGESVSISTGSKGGWDKFGPERTITRSDGHVVYEIDNKSALELYKGYLGEQAEGLPGTGLHFPLQIRENSSSERRLVRTCLAIDEATGSIVFAGDVPQGWKAQFMVANFERVIDGAGDAAEQSLKTAKKGGVTFAISCVGRRLVLGERAEEELELIKDVVGEETKILGFYSYGEFAPYAKGAPCELHNQTMTLFHVDEEEAA